MFYTLYLMVTLTTGDVRMEIAGGGFTGQGCIDYASQYAAMRIAMAESKDYPKASIARPYCSRF